MESTRQQKYARLIQKELSDIFHKEMKNAIGGTFITITSVRMSPDLGLAKVYLSFMLVNDRKEMLEKIETLKKPIRKALGDRIRRQARVIPELAFFLDDSSDYADKMDQLFKKIDIPPDQE